MRTLTERDLQAINREIAQLRTLISGFDSRARTNRAEITKLRGELTTLQAQIDTVQDDLATWTSFLAAFLADEDFVALLESGDVTMPTPPDPTDPSPGGGGSGTKDREVDLTE